MLFALDRCDPRKNGSFAVGAIVCVLIATLSLTACRAFAPIHVWKPPQLASVDGQRLVLMEITGPKNIANALREELFAQTNRPQHAVRDSATSGGIALLRPEQLDAPAEIQLVSAIENESSDLLIAAAARRSGVKYLLRGEIMHATGNPNSDQQLSVVWQLVGLDDTTISDGRSVTVNQALITQRYPDLVQVVDPYARLQQAMVRETLGLLNESVVRQQVTLAKPRATLGSTAVRRGNRMAERGDWPAAEEVWVETTNRYPGQVAAWINSAIAAAARQDFEEAKQRVSRAIQLSTFSPANRELAAETLVWLEMHQREYHQTFHLPDPPGGWRVTHSGSTATNSLP
jgi:hypothetical protein